MKVTLDVGEMEACRALDAIVAEKIHGWTDISISPTPYHPSRARDTGGVLVDLPYYSTRIADAWYVAERVAHFPFAGYGARLVITLFDSGCVHAWFCMRDSDDVLFKGVAETAPLAICRAALKASERELERTS